MELLFYLCRASDVAAGPTPLAVMRGCRGRDFR